MVFLRHEIEYMSRRPRRFDFRAVDVIPTFDRILENRTPDGGFLRTKESMAFLIWVEEESVAAATMNEEESTLTFQYTDELLDAEDPFELLI